MIESPYGAHLPILPTFYDAPTEDHLERVVERLVDRADAAFMAGKATAPQYAAWSSRMADWAKGVKTV